MRSIRERTRSVDELENNEYNGAKKSLIELTVDCFRIAFVVIVSNSSSRIEFQGMTSTTR